MATNRRPKGASSQSFARPARVGEIKLRRTLAEHLIFRLGLQFLHEVRLSPASAGDALGRAVLNHPRTGQSRSRKKGETASLRPRAPCGRRSELAPPARRKRKFKQAESD